MEEKKSKKGIIIAVIITLIVLVAAAIGGYFIYKNMEGDKSSSIGTDWGDTYYTYLANEKEAEVPTIQKDAERYEVQFIPLKENQTPVMTVKYNAEKDDKERVYFGIYHIKEDNTVTGFTKVATTGDFSTELLYNRESEEYKWYVKLEDDENNITYSDIEKEIAKSEITFNNENTENTNGMEEYIKANEDSEYVFTKTDMPVATIEETTAISKFEETFIVPNSVPEIKTITINAIDNVEEAKEEIKGAVSDYKPIENLVTEEVKQSVAEQTTNITNRENAIKEAEEAAKKAAEEKAKKEAEEEAKKGIKAGSYTLKYGTYKSEWGYTYTLKSDGTYKYSGITGSSSGKYKVYYYKGFKDEVEEEPAGWIIEFTPNSSSTHEESFYIKANNQFTALQYANTFKWKSN